MKTQINILKDPWIVVSSLIALSVLVPIAVIFVSSTGFENDLWMHLKQHLLPELISNTCKLSVGVLVLTCILGVSLAFLTSLCDFPGRNFFSWSLLLPLAVPAYVMAFVYTGLFDFSGPVQTGLRNYLPVASVHFPEIRSTGGVILVMSLAFYPYVFMLASSAFTTQGESTVEASRSLGIGGIEQFFKVTFPMARPWIFAGLLLVLMETLADFGTVSIFNYDTFTTAIYKAWFGFFSIGTATRLSTILVLFIIVVIAVEHLTRKNMKYYKNQGDRNRQRLKLNGAKAILAMSYASLVFFMGFLIPVIQLAVWSISVFSEEFNMSYLELIKNSLLLAGSGALLTIIFAIVLSSSERIHQNRFSRFITKISILGYALPGTVLAVGLVKVISAADKTIGYLGGLGNIQLPDQIFQGSVFVMVIGYMIRFMSAGFGSVSSSMNRITPSMDEAAKSMGTSRFKILSTIHFPLIKSGVFTGLILVFVEVMKEMPITLMTRPFGWDTLAVKIFELTSEGEWERAALPALVLIAVGILPVFLLTKQRGNRECS